MKKITEEEEDSLISMLMSDDEKDVNLALMIVNGMESNRRLLNKLIPDDYINSKGEFIYKSENIWYKSVIQRNGAIFFRRDHKGDIPLKFNRGEE